MAAAVRSPRTRLDPDARRAQLVELGLEVLAASPLDKVSVDQIAAAAGISRGLLFHYFASKRDFLVAVARAAAEELMAVTAPDPALPPVERLRASLESFVGYVDSHREQYLGLVRGSAGSDAELARIFDETRTLLADRVLEGLQDLAEPTPSVRMVTRGWVGFVEETAVTWLAGDRPIEREKLVSILEQSLLNLVALAVLVEQGT